MAKENTVLITDCVIISNAAPVACLFVCANQPSDVQAKSYPHLGTRGGGVVMEPTPSPVGLPRVKIKPIFERPLTGAPSVAAWRFNCALKW